MNERFRVLVSAYACHPYGGSEGAVGWNWVRQIARFHEVWVITRQNNRAAIEQALQEQPLANVHWLYFDLPKWARFWKKGPVGFEFYYQIWQCLIYFVARKAQRQVKFDLVHHVTFGRYWVPCYLAYLPATFVWGPVGGGEATPAGFFRTFELRGRVYETLRSLVRFISNYSPWLRHTAKRAVVALATTDQTARRLERLAAADVRVLPQYFFNQEEMQFFRELPRRTEPPIRFLSMGRLVHWKGHHLALQAFAQFCAASPEGEYWLTGTGPERARLERLAEQLGIAQRVHFWGRLPSLHDVYDKLGQSDVLLHPALHEAFGNACLEALAAGRPVICLDWGGPALQVTGETGFRIPPGPVDQTIAGLAEAMQQLARSPELRLRMGQAAQKRVREAFDWNTQGDWLNQLYHEVVQK